MRSISSDLSLVLIGGALTAAVGACTDFAGPIPGTEMPGTTIQPNTGTPTDMGNGVGTGTPPAGNGDNGAMPPPNDMGSGDLVSFDEDVHPILVMMCGNCHAEPAGGLPGHGAADADASFEQVTSMSGGEPVYQRILARAAGDGGFMPPGYVGCEALGSPGCLSQEQYDTIALWVQQGASNR